MCPDIRILFIKFNKLIKYGGRVNRFIFSTSGTNAIERIKFITLPAFSGLRQSDRGLILTLLICTKVNHVPARDLNNE